MALARGVDHRSLRVTSHPGGAYPMVVVDLEFLWGDRTGRGQNLTAARANDLLTSLYHILRHGHVNGFVVQMNAGKVEPVAVLALGIQIHKLFCRDQGGSLHVHPGMADAFLFDLSLEFRTEAINDSTRQSPRGKSGAALHLVSPFKISVGPIPIEPCQQAVIVVRAVVIGRIAVAQFMKVPYDGNAKMARQVPADLAAMVCQPSRKFPGSIEQ